jgi:hypothetical protein
MASIIEMAARNELLRRDGRHPAREFLERLEKTLVPPPPEEPRAPAGGLARPSRRTWSTLAPNAGSTESSAWVPAVGARRTQGKGDE